MEIGNAVSAAKVKFVMEVAPGAAPVKEVEELSPELSVRALIKCLVDHFGFFRNDVEHFLGKALVTPELAAKEGCSLEEVQC